jgi:hypothetical protein
MIELDLIKSSDKASSLRGQLNTAFSEIMADQAMIGTPSGATLKAYLGSVLVTTIDGASLQETIYFDCLPESNGVFVTAIHGSMYVTFPSAVSNIEITVPTIALPTRDATVSTFVSPAHLGITESATKYGVGTCICCDASADQALTDVKWGVTMIDSHDTTLTIYAAVRGTNSYAAGNQYIYF